MGRKKLEQREDRKPTPRFQQWMNQGGVPVATKEVAMVFAKLLSVGCPAVRAVLFISPEMPIETAKQVAKAWLHDAEVLAAVSELNGGEWVHLPVEKRLQLALDKHLSEMAFYLWTSNFNDIEHKEGLEKMKQARDVLKAELGRQPDEADPMQAFARFALELGRNMQNQKQVERAAKKAEPPQLQASPLDKALNGPM